MGHRGAQVQGAAVHTVRTLAATALAAALAAVAPLEDATGAAPGLSTCVNPDNGVPVVQDVRLSTGAIDVTDSSRAVEVSMQVVDTAGPGPATGVRHVSAALSPPGGVPELAVDLEHVEGSLWSARVTVPRGAPEGDYAFRGLRVLDRAGNEPSEEYRDQALASPPFDGTTLHVTSAAPDVEPPVLSSVTVGPRQVDTRRAARRVRVVALVSDDVSGTESVAATLRGHGEILSVDLHERDGAWVGRATIPRWLGRRPDRWRLRSVSAVDHAGNRRFYGRQALEGLGTTTFRVRSGPLDRHEPRIRSTRFGPRDVDVRVERRRVRFVVRAEDDRSGARSVRAGVPGHWTTLHRAAGSARRGTWRGSIVLRPCSPHLRSSPVRVVVLDRAGNETDQRVGRLRIRARDTVTPRVSLKSPLWTTRGPVRLDFDEQVRGISTESITVRRYDYPFVGDPVAGGWACAAATGDPTDCVDGAVRSASWTPESPLPAGSHFLVELNPSGTLDVMDPAGNPFRRTIRYGRTERG